MATPTLATHRLFLRKLKIPSSRQLEWLRNPNVVQFSEQRHRTHTIQSQLRWIESFAGHSHAWGIFRASDDEHIGNITSRHDEDNNVSDIGILIGEESAWRHGFAGEAWNCVTDYLLREGVRKLSAGCMKVNTPMIRLLQSQKWKFEAEIPNKFLYGGGPVGAVYYARYK